MKTVNNIYQHICTYGNLYTAWCKTRKGKRFTDEGSRFEFHLEQELQLLQQELSEKKYTPGQYKSFYVYEPKKRMISAAPLRDRVVHHAVCNIIEPIFEPTFIYDSYANRKGKGTHKAIERYQYFCRMKKYVLKCDIKKFFPSIDLEILKALYRRKIACNNTLLLLDTIIDGSNAQEDNIEYFSNDTLFTPYERRRGLPIGNLTSQFSANVYLNPLDHFIKDTLGCKAYVRYVDDFVLLSDNKKELNEWKIHIKQFLNTLRLKVHSHKTKIYRVEDGIEFLGHRVFPEFRLLKKSNVKRFRKRLKNLADMRTRKKITTKKITERIQSWIAHASFSDTTRLRSKIFSTTSFS